MADPVLQSLAAETGETAVITRRIGLAAVCLQEAQSTQPLRVNLAPGTSIPLHRGALAKVLLAYAPPDIIDEFLAQEPKATPRPRRPKELKKELAAIVAAGVARSEGEFIAGTVTIAVPIIREDGIVAAIGVIGPDERCGLAWRARVARILPGAAAAIVGSLGAAAAGCVATRPPYRGTGTSRDLTIRRELLCSASRWKRSMRSCRSVTAYASRPIADAFDWGLVASELPSAARVVPRRIPIGPSRRRRRGAPDGIR